MEESMFFGGAGKRAAKGDEYDIEQQLSVAERKYAEARERSRQAREECHALEAEEEARAELVKQARVRYESAEAKCQKLRRLIEDLEERAG
jgi:chromosome segregation ATPase